MEHIVKITEKIAQAVNGKPAMISSPSQPLTPSPGKPCPACNGQGFARYDVPVGHPQFGKLKRCDHPSHSEERMVKIAKVSGLTDEDTKRRLSNLIANNDNREMLEAAREFITDPYGLLYIWGGPGNAKSEVLISIVNETMLQGKTVLYTKLSRILDYMREAFSEHNYRDKNGPDTGNMGYIDRFERLKAVQVLAIDEMDKIRSTPFVEEFCFEFLDERYRQAIRGETVTVFASNSDPAEFPPAIYDRLRDGRFKIVFNGSGSARPFMKRGE